DTVLTQAVDAQRSAQQKQREPQQALEQALSKGDWDAARKAAASVRDGVAAMWAAQTAVKIDVLALLDANQRQTVASTYPQLLRQPSVFWAPKGPPPIRPTPAQR